MSRLLKGLLPGFIYCPTASDVHRAIELAETYKFKAKLVLGRDGWKAAAEIAKKGYEVVLDPELEYWETDEERQQYEKAVLAIVRHARIEMGSNGGPSAAVVIGMQM